MAFRNAEDVEFYDRVCGAHGVFKGVVGGRLEVGAGRAGVCCLNWG